MRSLTVVCMAVALAGCATGSVLGTLPAVDPATAAQIVVVRPSQYLGRAGCGDVPASVEFEN
jgi:hypothetical protein